MNSLKNCSESYYTTFRKCMPVPGKISALLFLSFSLLQSCGPSYEEMKYREASMMLADSIAGYSPGLVTDTINGITHNFIRSAELKFRVRDVLESSNRIQQLVTKRGGYITSSSLSSNISYSTSVKFKADSLLESIYYTSTNIISLRIPNKQLDSLLGEISDLSVFIDHRNLRAEDAKMMVYANSLSEKRSDDFTKTLKKEPIKNTGSPKHQLKVQERLLEEQEQLDHTSIASYSLADKINYSTVSLDLCQAEQLSTQVVPVFPVTEPYRPSFASEIKDSFLSGFGILRALILLIIKGWVLILPLLILFLLLKKLKTPLRKSYSTGTEN